MRHDMYKVIVERPRIGAGNSRCRRTPDDPEDSPRQEGLRRRHTRHKCLNENLRPLERYLASQVGRPWDKVYSEICAGIDRRNTVQQHIHEHLEDFVAIRVTSIDGVLYECNTYGSRVRLDGYWASRFYVDPDSGMLRANRLRAATRARYQERCSTEARHRRAGRREDRLIVDASTQLHRIGGLWFRVELAPVEGNESAIDVLRHLPAGRCPQWRDDKHGRCNDTLFGDAGRFAIGKRQLNARELRHYLLRNDSE